MYVLLGGLIGGAAGFMAAQFFLGGGNGALAVGIALAPGLVGHVIAQVVLSRRQELAASAMAEVVGEDTFMAAGRALVARRREASRAIPDSGFDDAEFGFDAPDPVQSDLYGVQTGANSLPAGYRRQF